MKKIKLALHWQIIIALGLAVIFGILFPTKYQLNNEEFLRLKKNSSDIGLSVYQLHHIETLTYNKPVSESVFFEQLGKIAEEPLSKTQKNLITDKSEYNPELNYVSWMGDIFIRALKMIIIPLILASIISGVANIGSAKNLGRLGLKTMLYYLSTSTFAIITGLLLVNLIKPGLSINPDTFRLKESFNIDKHSLGDTLIEIVPDNIFQAFVNQDMLSIIFFSMLFGFFITRVEPKYSQLLGNFFNSFFEVMMKITLFIIRFTPLGIFGLVATIVAEQAGDPARLYQIAEGLGLYSLTVLLALTIHSVIILPIYLKIIGKSKPYAHFRAMRNALLTAFSTSSSGATLSLTMDSVKNKSGVSNKISGFTLPLGATINMDGTALYECVAVIFIAQAYGFDLSIAEQVIIVITALLASIGAAAIPMAGLIMISIILAAVDLPLAGIGLILSVDRILDMFRTSVNVWSDSCGAVIIAKSEGEKLNV
ncbi:MAG: dicarboxylate/amino acid:cation symporter [Bacteroidota bacterium]|nr:dicarboxylate/amino acid:cation symporter [Bacteroidota bacterium]